jgi:hypothetical protein
LISHDEKCHSDADSITEIACDADSRSKYDLACPSPLPSARISDLIQNLKHDNNTHTYDGKLPKNSILRKIMNSIISVPNHFKKVVAANFIKHALTYDIPEKSDVSARYIENLLVDWGTNANNSETDNVRVDDLLYVCAIEWNVIVSAHTDTTADTESDAINNAQNTTKECPSPQEFAREFFIQCADMSTGACPQGRVTRLWQIADAYVEWYQ